jgi:hypothetical protein
MMPRSPNSSASSVPPCSRFVFSIPIRVYPRRSAVGFAFPITCDDDDVARSRRFPWYVFLQMEKKIFWLLFTVLGVVMGIFLPLWWNLALTLPLLVLCWWVVYRSGWLS